MAALDDVLDMLYRTAAADVPGPDRLRRVTIRPPAGQAEGAAPRARPGSRPRRRRADRSHSPASSPARTRTSRTGWREAYRSDIEGHTQHTSRAAGPRIGDAGPPVHDGAHGADRGGGQEVDRPGVRSSGRQSRSWPPTRTASAATSTTRGRTPISAIEGMSPDQKRALARDQLLRYQTWNTRVAEVLREHHAVPAL